MCSTIVMLVAADVEACRIPAAAARTLLHLLRTTPAYNSQLGVAELGLQAMTDHLEGHLSLLAQHEQLRLDEFAADLVHGRVKLESPLGVVQPVVILHNLRGFWTIPRQTKAQLCLGSTCKSTPLPIPFPD